MSTNIIKEHFNKQNIRLNVGFGLIYFTIARLSLLLATISESASPVWPATGFAFFIVYTYGIRVLPAVLLGAFSANFHANGFDIATCFISIGNSIEAYLGGLIITRLSQIKNRFSYQGNTIAIVVASVVSTTASATLGVATLFYTGAIKAELVSQVWFTWWIGDALGGLIFAPILIYFKRFCWRDISLLHFSILIFATLLTVYFIYSNPAGKPFVFLLFPLILYAAFFLKEGYVYLVAVFIAIVSIAFTIGNFGPFAAGSLNDRLIHLQLFLVSIGLTALTLTGFVKVKLSKMPALVLIFCWLISGALFYSFETNEQKKDEDAFQYLANDLQADIVRRMAVYEYALMGGVGLYAASESVELSEWREFFNTLNITEHYPGIKGLGVVWKVKHSDLSKFQQDMANQGLKNFKVKPVPGYTLNNAKDGNHYVIKFIEPLEDNLPAAGLDLSSEPNRRFAADLAQDTGKSAITSKISLVQEPSGKGGFLYFLPIYKNGIKNLSSNERRAANIGWVYGPFSTDKFFNIILSKYKGKIELQAFDDSTANQKNLIYSSSSQTNTHKPLVATVIMGQRPILLSWTRGPNFITSHNSIIAWVGLCGALISLLLTNLVMGLQVINQRSQEMALDLTKELRQAKQLAEDDHQFLLKVADLAPNNLYILDFKTKAPIYHNVNVMKTLGYSTEEIKNKGFNLTKEITHPDDWHLALERFDKLEKSYDGEIVETVRRVKSALGKWHWLLIRESVFKRDANGTPEQIIGVSQDITDIKMAEQDLLFSQEKLKDSERRLVFALEGSSDGIWDWDLINKEVYVSEKLSKLFGGQQIVKMSSVNDMAAILHPDDIQNVNASFNQHLSGETSSLETEVRLKSESNAWKWVLVRGKTSQRKDDGTPARITGVYIDIDRLKKTEEALEVSRQEALEANKVKSQFLANMSHEIRTPISGIIGMTNLLRGTALDLKQQDFVELTNRSAEGLLAIVNDILDFSKYEAGKLNIEKINFDLKDLVMESVRSFSYLANQKSIELKLDADFKQVYFKGDPVRIRQILTNLIGNAIKFTHTGSVTLKIQYSNATTSSTNIKFEVIDTGIGIPQDALKRLFQAFTQADSSTNRKFGGTGLGLSICKGLVKLMGGEIDVISSIGKGSTFWFQLNLESGAPNQSATVVNQEAESFALNQDHKKNQIAKKIHVLVVEDNKINQEVISHNLANLSCTYELAENGIEAIKLAESKTYDLILMDCHMPEMDGYEATKQIRKLSGNSSKTPIIAITANTSQADYDKCLEAGMSDFLTKPVRLDLLIKCISKWSSAEDNSNRFHPAA